jgi:signal transduction histidine kinase
MLRRSVTALAVILGVSAATICIGALKAESEQPAILLLAVDDQTRPSVQNIVEGFKDVVLADATPPILYFETLDAVRFPEPAHLERFRTWLRDKYRDRRIDLVVPIGEDAVYFLASQRGEPWPDVPVLYTEAGGLTHDVSEQLPLATGFVFEDHFPAALGVIKAILPDTQHVVMVYGASQVERQRAGGFADKVRASNLGLEASDLVGLPMNDLLAQVGQLSERTILFLGAPQRDSAGRVYATRRPCEVISAAANRPTFSMGVNDFGCGVVGGLLRDFTVLGRLLAEEALGRLRNPPSVPQTVVVPSARFTTLSFDARQLGRWGIDERRLPPGSAVQFRQPNLWRDYPKQVAAAMTIALVQTLLIGGLLFEHRRRRSAERQMRRDLVSMALLERRAAMGQLTASLTHELNQPLGAILRNAEAGKMLAAPGSPATHDELKDIFEDIRADDKRASDIIRRIRTLLEKRELEVHPVDVNDVARETTTLLAPDAASRGVRVDLELAAAPSVVMGDRVHLQQVLLNLLLNGMEAMAGTPPERRRLVARTTRLDGHVDVSVTDTGEGLPTDSASRLFEPFYTTKPQGMGMGLSIARSLVEAHGGHITAENNIEGGATVRFSIPSAPVT